MIVEYVRYRIGSDQAESFLQAYRVAEEHLRASPHCLAFELSRCTEASEHYVLRIEWDSAEGHLKGFRSGPQFPPFLQAVRPFTGDIEEMRHYEPTTLRWSRKGVEP